MEDKTILHEGTTSRQSNGSAFLPQFIWERMSIDMNEEFNWTLEQRKKGIFLAMYKKESKK